MLIKLHLQLFNQSPFDRNNQHIDVSGFKLIGQTHIGYEFLSLIVIGTIIQIMRKSKSYQNYSWKRLLHCSVCGSGKFMVQILWLQKSFPKLHDRNCTLNLSCIAVMPFHFSFLYYHFSLLWPQENLQRWWWLEPHGDGTEKSWEPRQPRKHILFQVLSAVVGLAETDMRHVCLFSSTKQIIINEILIYFVLEFWCNLEEDNK